jgi:predicted double-glycine peptidase
MHKNTRLKLERIGLISQLKTPGKRIPMKSRIALCCALFFLVGLAAGWVARSAEHGPRIMRVAAAPLLLAVPDVFQSTSYSCGASALQSILAYWGIEVREDELLRSLATTEQRGTAPESILRVARSYGLGVRMHEGTTVNEIRAALAKGMPVILDVQAWPEQASVRNTGWDRDWEDGHYVVAIGLDDTNIYVEDPSLFGCRGFIPLNEFESRWHDYEGDPPYNRSQRTYVRLAIFIEGTKKVAPTPLCRVN